MPIATCAWFPHSGGSALFAVAGLDRDELVALSRRCDAPPTGGPFDRLRRALAAEPVGVVGPALAYAEAAAERLITWTGILDDAGADIEPSREACLELVAARPDAVVPLTKALLRASGAPDVLVSASAVPAIEV